MKTRTAYRFFCLAAILASTTQYPCMQQTPSTEEAPIQHMPDLPLQTIATFCSTQDIINMRATCKDMRNRFSPLPGKKIITLCGPKKDIRSLTSLMSSFPATQFFAICCQNSQGNAPRRLAKMISELPSEISRKLVTIDLANTQLKSLPSKMLCPNVQCLILAGNCLGRNRITLQKKLAKYPQLTYLDLSGNHLSGPPLIGSSLPNLRHLLLSDNALGKLPTELYDLVEGCPHVHTLDLSHNNCSIPESLALLTQLHHLSLAHNHGNYKELDATLALLTQLKSLDISGMALAKVPASIGHMHHLTHLCLKNNPLGTSKHNQLNDILAALTYLEKLDLSSTDLKIFPSPIIHLEHLKKVCLAGLPLDIPAHQDNYLLLDEFCAQHTQLKKLVLTGTDLSCIPPTMSKLVELETLSLADNPKLGSQIHIICELITHCQRLKKLHLENTCLTQLPDTLHTLPVLEELNLALNPHLGQLATTLDRLDRCLALTRLNLAYTGLSQLPTTLLEMIHLHELNLAGNNLTKKDIHAAHTHLPCTHITLHE